MRSRFLIVALLSAATAAPAGQKAPEAPLPDRVAFNRDIRPILSDNCGRCHGPDEKARKAGLRLDTREGATAPLDGGGAAVVPGNPARSLMVRHITSKDPDFLMPPPKSNKKLSPREIALLVRWIEQGAEYQGHWAFIPPLKAPPPAVKDRAWVRNPIDAFVLARLEKEGLKPSPEADRVTLLRRLAFDLVGLPPRIEDVDAFLADGARDACEKQVERLLSTPHHGERMAIFWLDLVRFANSRGYHSDNPRMVDPYRDYVISAFNENLRFDRFTLEQLAGDLLPDATLRQRVASCYNKLNQTTEEGGAQAKEYEYKTHADRVRSVSSAWMGATMGCAECHDHKFDPYTMRDFYSMAAFFADVKEGAISDGDKGVLVPDAKQEAELRRLDDAIAALKKKLETPTPELEAAQKEWELAAAKPFPWTVLLPESLKSQGGATFLVEEDGSIVVSGPSPAKDQHQVTVKTDLKGITAFRLEALTWPTLPGNGPGRAPNGNLVLSRFSVIGGPKRAELVRSSADHSQDQFPVAAALDAKPETGWALLPQVGREHVATFEPKEPTDGPLTFVLEYQSVHPQHVLGRFRLSATTVRNPSDLAAVSPAVRDALKLAPEKRGPEQKAAIAAHYRTLAPLLEPARAEIAAADKSKADCLKTIPTCLVSAAGPPRMVKIKPRGNWMDESGEACPPATPRFLPPLGAGEARATRIDLARWLCSKENPLTARVFVNRLWKHFFGTGISKVLDDLGAQGEWPVHPELLDWLAVEFVESGWDVRHMIRLLVTSSAYRQSSAMRPELKDRDPYNRLAARQSRWRHDAEIVRDNALALAGLLSPRIGGTSVYPYQPKGYWSFLNFPTREWSNSSGEDYYRRGVYTWWQRTFPHPSLTAFDAPSREECCAERTRSNIPQQALVLLNDPTYVEAARVFAEKALREGGDDRLSWAFRRAVSRKPSPAERKHREQYAADRRAAELVVAAGPAPAAKDLDAVELAAWTSVARALLNLHETITRN
jgi:cytochrome c553